MTGFAKKNGDVTVGNAQYSWSWEIKSVNGKSLDLKAKHPSWLGDLSGQLKSILGKSFARGSFAAFLNIESNHQQSSVKVNEELLGKLIDMVSVGSENTLFGKTTIGEIFNIKGVIEVEECKIGEEELKQLNTEINKTFEVACNELKKSRDAEGKEIKAVLLEILKKIEENTNEIAKIFETIPEAIKEKLQNQLKELVDSSIGVSEERLAQEVVMLVNRADLREEVDRLRVHIKSAEKMLNSSEPVGRKLDFLCQELNREANTTCSKSVDMDITNLAMELKALIEQFREQVQNVE